MTVPARLDTVQVQERFAGVAVLLTATDGFDRPHRLVLAVVNFALNRFGIEVFDQIVVGRASTRKWLRREALGRGKPGNPPADCGCADSF